MNAPLLVELFTEELPPKALKSIADAFADRVWNGLIKAQLCTPEGRTVYATPRRIAVSIQDVRKVGDAREVEIELMQTRIAYDAAGAPTPALHGKLKKIGGTLDDCFVTETEGVKYVSVRQRIEGAELARTLQKVLDETWSKLPIPKVMRYQTPEGEDVQFVRPAHRLVALHGVEVVPVQALGLKSGRETFGHRFLSQGAIRVVSADSYERQLDNEGFVVADFDARKRSIEQKLATAAAAHQAKLAESEALLDEVTALVEFPEVYAGTFDSAFLAVPQECLILSMKQHQKYFPLVDAAGKLLPKFLIVSNLKTADSTNIVRGNERVLRARLADAKFFFDQDRKARLETRVEKLGAVVYHNKLGSQLQRVQRISRLAGEIAGLLRSDVDKAERAGRLAKADLVTDMVGEFPELQGTMGMYYARHDGEDEAVARAIEAHYHPRFANDSLPEDNIGAAVALADKLETLTGIYGIGLVPTGDKDPFGLRRAALGVLRILVEKQLPLDLTQLLQLARAKFTGDTVAESVAVDLHGFMLERLRGYLRERGYEASTIDAVIAQQPSRIDLVIPRVEAVRDFLALPEAASLAAANKRIRNILKKAEGTLPEPEFALLQEPAEKALFAAVTDLAPKVGGLVGDEDYAAALELLAGARQPVDTFFDEVMVMAEEPVTRRNRLGLLSKLNDLMNAVADISRLAS